MTEKEKMISGQIYQPWDKELTTDRENAKDLCFKLNQTLPSDREARADILHELLDLEGSAWIESPFNCDYGYNIKAGNGFYANHGCTILDAAPVTFGNDCLLAPGWLFPPLPTQLIPKGVRLEMNTRWQSLSETMSGLAPMSLFARA